MGSFLPFDSFCTFVSNMQYASTPDILADFAIVARGVFDEVANESPYRIESMEGIFDCLTNRVQNYPSTWSNYLIAAQKWGLNSINPNHTGYWKGMNVIRPIESASFNSDARDTLIQIYTICFDKFELGIYYIDPHLVDSNF